MTHIERLLYSLGILCLLIALFAMHGKNAELEHQIKAHPENERLVTELIGVEQ